MNINRTSTAAEKLANKQKRPYAIITTRSGEDKKIVPLDALPRGWYIERVVYPGRK